MSESIDASFWGCFTLMATYFSIRKIRFWPSTSWMRRAVLCAFWRPAGGEPGGGDEGSSSPARCTVADRLLASAQQGGQVSAILDEEFGDISPPGPDQPWQRWLTGLAERLRRAAARPSRRRPVISAAQLSRSMAASSELAMSTLVAHGIPLRQARVIVLTVERFTLGHVLEEQAPARTRTR